jgi:hypothetical protein
VGGHSTAAAHSAPAANEEHDSPRAAHSDPPTDEERALAAKDGSSQAQIDARKKCLDDQFRNQQVYPGYTEDQAHNGVNNADLGKPVTQNPEDNSTQYYINKGPDKGSIATTGPIQNTDTTPIPK